MIQELTPKDFSKKDKNSYYLIDVRTKDEFDLVNIGGSLIPLDEINSKSHEIKDDKDIVLLCHHGRRSMFACQMLDNLGFQNLFNLTGGIDRYAIDVDQTIKRY
ncbi:rhodanese-like domain-containing protein [Rickettsiales bacterium]|nr:rhodanese-like domain-containing protein [Rickettsiales bacterium]